MTKSLALLPLSTLIASIETVVDGAAVSIVTLLSLEVDALLLTPLSAVTVLAGKESVTSPSDVTLTVTSKVVPSLGATCVMVATLAVALPPSVKSLALSVAGSTGVVKVTVKVTLLALVGSGVPDFCSSVALSAFCFAKVK